MNRSQHWAAVLGVGLVLIGTAASRADGPQDLAAGKAALERGQFEQALPLLASAAQALPQSVEAQVALAECQLKRGALDKALEQYQAVLKLSPDHAAAKNIVAGLTGAGKTIAEKIALVETFLRLGNFAYAETVAVNALKEPADLNQREQMRLLLAQARLWNHNLPGAVEEATRLIQAGVYADDGQAIVAAALVLGTPLERERGLALIREPGAAPVGLNGNQVATAPKPLSELASLIASVNEHAVTAELSAKFAGKWNAVPDGPYQTAAVTAVMDRLLADAARKLDQGDVSGTIALVWPVVGNGAAPGADAALKPVEAVGGWLPNRLVELRVKAAHLLAQTGQAEIEQRGANATLLGPWLAAEVLRRAANAERIGEPAGAELVSVIQSLATLSRPSSQRKPGKPLSRADQMQAALFQTAVSLVTTEAQRQACVDAASELVNRYQRAGDEAYALTVLAPRAEVSQAVGRIPPGAARQKWTEFLAGRYSAQGQQAFQKAAATLAADANKSLNGDDEAALKLFGLLDGKLSKPLIVAYAEGGSGAAPSSPPRGETILVRYESADRWDAATAGLKLLHPEVSDTAAAWEQVRMKLRRAAREEDKYLVATRRVDKAMVPLDAVGEAIKLSQATGTKESRLLALQVVDPLVARYVTLERPDLAVAVIDAVTAAAPDFGDWVLWTKATMQSRDAVRTLVVTMDRIAPEKLTLDKRHEAELALLQELIAKHPQSEYFPRAIARVGQIANDYRDFKAFGVAQKVLEVALKANSKLDVAPRWEYQIVQIQFAKAQMAFQERKDKIRPPAELSVEFKAVLDALAGYVKSRPATELTPAAMNDLLAVARTYGEAGAWPISRQVLDRFAAAVPDFRAPAQMKLWQAATHLGELDRAHGLALLNPAAPARPRASLFDSHGALVFDDFIGAADNPLAGTLRYAAPRPTEVAAAGTPAAPNPGGFARGMGMGRGGPGGGGAGGRGAAAGGQGGNQQDATSTGALTLGAANVAEQLGDLLPADAKPDVVTQQANQSLAAIRQVEQQRTAQIAALKEPEGLTQQQQPGLDVQFRQNGFGDAQQAIALPGGPVLSEAEMKRQDDAAEKAYVLLLDLVKANPLTEASLSDQARQQLVWLFGFFETQLRPDRSVVLIRRFIADQPIDATRIALAFRALNDQLNWSYQRQPTEPVNKQWIDARHVRFETSRKDIGAFIKEYAEKDDWVGQARLLSVDSYDREAQLATAVSPVRAAGLLVSSVDALVALYRTTPNHPAAANFPDRMRNIAERLQSLHQEDSAVYVLSQIPIHFPTHPRAKESVMRIAQLYSVNLANPLRAVETYQEFLSVAGDNQDIRTQIYSIGQQLTAKQRYLEALQVFAVFVDSFPTDPRAAEVLRAIGQVHQSNEAWNEAIAAYKRVLDEYKSAPIVPQVKLALAECQINLSQWKQARKLYEEFVQDFPQDGQAEMARSRMDVLKNLDRYQILLADEQVQRNKDDAQFQIGVIVNEKLGNHVKAIMEFRKLVSTYPKSAQAAAAQLEIGKGLIAENKLDDARKELLKVPQNYPTSPLADDALYLLAQSYERDAQKLASVTLEKAKAEAFEKGQRGAYQQFNENFRNQDAQQQQVRDELRKAGKAAELELNAASNAFRQNGGQNSIVANSTLYAEQQAETASALQVANRQDRINDAYRQAVAMYTRVAKEYPLGDVTDKSLLRMAQIFDTELKDRAASMATFQQVVKFFPGTPVAEDAAWKVARFQDQEGKYQESVDSYREFIRNYPASARVADAQFAMAEALEQLGRWVEAMDAYETFRQKFTAHPKAQSAQDQINWIRAYRK